MNLVALDTFTVRKDAWFVMERSSWLSDQYTINSYIFGGRTESRCFSLSMLISGRVQKNAFEEDAVHALENRE